MQVLGNGGHLVCLNVLTHQAALFKLPYDNWQDFSVLAGSLDIQL